ncbi:MAG TPA: GntG family PLP-dependent aldolase [Candidatus Dormibacteraeota bacterium]
MPVVDMRSDTLTMPTPEMRRAMAEAELGDDVFGEDPTVNRLQERAAAAVGKEAGLFVASGTMGNLLGILAQVPAGKELIADAESHVFLYEGAGAATLGGIQVRPIATEHGVLSRAQVEAAFRPSNDYHQPLTGGVTIENTHNRQGGVAWPLAAVREVAEAAHERGVPVHMDGARIFNAALAVGTTASEVAAPCDTVTFCVSKGLGAPVGSVLCGPAEVIDRAARWRKMVGGGWREAGVLAAAGLLALEKGVDHLREDHSNARTLAEGLAEMPGVEIDLARVQTNLVIFRLTSLPAEQFLEECAARGLKGGGGYGRVRFVTRLGITPADVQHALEVCSEVLEAHK